MGYILTDGKEHITYEHPHEAVPACRGKVRRTADTHDAYLFGDYMEAQKELRRLTKAAKGFSVEKAKDPAPEAPAPAAQKKEPAKPKRKQISKELRREVYRKTEGHCYLCGAFVDYDLFEVEHVIPVTAGGTYEIGNLYCSCHTCNTMKGSMPLHDMLEHAERITQHNASREKEKDRGIRKFFPRRRAGRRSPGTEEETWDQLTAWDRP